MFRKRSFQSACLDWNGSPCFFNQLFAFFIDANYRIFRIIFFFIQIQQPIHPLPVFRCYLRNTPHLSQPRFTFVFFSINRTLSRLIGLDPGRAFNVSVNNSNVHLVLPSGALLQARAITSASLAAVWITGCPDLGSSSNADSIPRRKNFCFVRLTVFRPISKKSAISDACFPLLRSNSMFVLFISLKLLFSCCLKSFRYFTCSGVRLIVVCLMARQLYYTILS